MNTNRVVRNAGWIIGVRIVQSLLSFLIGMLTAQFLGPSNYGLINYAASIVAFFTPLMELGITSVIVHDLVDNEAREGKIIGTAITMNLMSSLLCICGIVGFVFLVNRGETETVIVCSLYSILLVFKSIEIVQYWFQAHLFSKYSSVASLIAYVVVSGYRVFLLITQKSVYWFAVSYAIDSCVIAVLLLILYKRLGGSPLRVSFDDGKRLFGKGKYYIVSSMMVTIFAQTDKIMIKQMLNSESVGYYSAAVSCASLFSFVISAIIDSFRPVIFQKRKESVNQFEGYLIKLYTIIIYFALAQSLLMTIGAKIMVSIIYGQDYYPATSALRIIVWYTTFSYLGAVRNIWLLAESKQKYLWKINLSGAVANIALNALLIPLMGINGAALASLATQFFTNVIIGFVLVDIRRNNMLMLKSLNPHSLRDIAEILLHKNA